MPLFCIRFFRHTLLVTMGLLTLPTTGLSEAPYPPQDRLQLRTAALAYLRLQSSLPKDSRIDIQALDDRLRLSQCEQLHFVPPVQPLQGNIRLKAECRAPENWSVLLNVNIQRPVNYFVLRSDLDGSRPLREEDLQAMQQFSTHPLPGLSDDLQQIIGLRLNHALKAGSPIRIHDLSSEPALSRGQTVKLVSLGRGFQISSEGLLLRNSFDGQNTQVQLASRRVLSGIAHKGGIVEIRP